MTAWRERHPPEKIDVIVETTIKSMRSKLGVKKIGAVGYWYASSQSNPPLGFNAEIPIASVGNTWLDSLPQEKDLMLVLPPIRVVLYHLSGKELRTH